MLRERSICKHSGSVTLECSLFILKQAATFQTNSTQTSNWNISEKILALREKIPYQNNRKKTKTAKKKNSWNFGKNILSEYVYPEISRMEINIKNDLTQIDKECFHAVGSKNNVDEPRWYHFLCPCFSVVFVWEYHNWQF